MSTTRLADSVVQRHGDCPGKSFHNMILLMAAFIRKHIKELKMVSFNFVLFFVMLFSKYNMIIEHHGGSITCYVIRNSLFVKFIIPWDNWRDKSWMALVITIRKKLIKISECLNRNFCSFNLLVFFTCFILSESSVLLFH